MVLNTPIDFAKPYTGGIEWDVEILPKDQADPAFTFKAEENHSWIYPRVAGANMLKVGDEYEDYLFYRGVGNFSSQQHSASTPVRHSKWRTTAKKPSHSP